MSTGVRDRPAKRNAPPARRRSSSCKRAGICSVTARKAHPDDKVGLELKEEEQTGRYKVSKIASDGIFAETEVQIGDIVLSLNGESVKDFFIDELLLAGEEAEDKVTLVIRQTDAGKRIDRRTETGNPNEVVAEKDGAIDAGIRFVVKEKRLLVKNIQEDSIFKDAALKVGDCVTKINDMYFLEYVDADYALMMANKKGPKTVTLKLARDQ